MSIDILRRQKRPAAIDCGRRERMDADGFETRITLEKRVQLGIPLIGIGCGDDRRGGWIFRLDAIDLLGIENGIALKKRHLTLAVLAALSTLVGVNLDLVGIDDGRTLLEIGR